MPTNALANRTQCCLWRGWNNMSLSVELFSILFRLNFKIAQIETFQIWSSFHCQVSETFIGSVCHLLQKNLILCSNVFVKTRRLYMQSVKTATFSDWNHVDSQYNFICSYFNYENLLSIADLHFQCLSLAAISAPPKQIIL